MSLRYKAQQDRRIKLRMQKQATFPEASDTRAVAGLRRTATVPRPGGGDQFRGSGVGRDTVDGRVLPPSVQTRNVGFKRRYQPASRPASDTMSDSGRSSPFIPPLNTERSTRPQVVRQNAAASSPSSPSPLNTDESFQPYSYRVDDLTAQEREWFEKIKIFDSVDVPDDVTFGSVHDLNRQISGNPQVHNSNQTATNAFGRIHFQGGRATGMLPSWYVRMAVDTTGDLLQELLETKLEVMNSSSHPLRFHCIDYNSWPSNVPLLYRGQPLNSQSDSDLVTTKLQRDLCSMCKKTAGIVLTWSGLGGANIMHNVLGGIVEESRFTRKHITNFACIATPPWSALEDNIRQELQVKGKDVNIRDQTPIAQAEDLDDDQDDDQDDAKEEQELPRLQCSLGSKISQYATHFLMLDNDRASAEQVLSSDTEKSNFRHFHYLLINAMENAEKRKTRQMPVVCVLINGHHDALKMVDFALKKSIPVLIVQGSGGYADVIADVYLNAVSETTKFHDDRDQVRTRITKRAGEKGKFYLEDPATRDPRLAAIFDKLDLLTVYIPSLSVQTLDSVVFEALLKHKQEEKFGGLVEIMQKSKKLQHRLTSSTEKSSFIDSYEVQMGYFIEAVKQNSVDVVKIFLERLDITDKLMRHFHMGRVLRLYSENMNKGEKLIDFRERFMKLLQKLTVLPLRCVGRGCPNCDVKTTTKSKVSELAVQRTCLHPIQELFLWTLHNQHVEMAVLFWEKCEDKIAAALVARKVFKAMSKECSDPDIRWQMEENIRQFQSLAMQTLRSCHNMDEQETELLLTKPCPWWGNLSVLQLAIITENREFMTQTACHSIMTRIWYGRPWSDPDMAGKGPCKLVTTLSSSPCCPWDRCSPFLQYLANFGMQLLFLLLFSYELLFDLGHSLTPLLTVLIVWVVSVTCEEFRQLGSKHAVLKDSSLETSGITRTKLVTYLSQGWNQIDVATVVLFWLGMMILCPKPAVQVFGRLLLSLDIFFFFMRTFQMLMVFEEIGLMLVMVYKMVKDTRNFMIILLVFVLAYSVASESLLYPESNFSWARFFHLPGKAYWQVFGELGLEEIEIRDRESCSFNKSKHYGYDDPHCPSDYGSYIVPILLGIYVMITNVLLLNLLIARFGVTFNKVHDEACEYQSWHRCQIITEYYNRTSLPPPFNLLHVLYYIIVQGCVRIGRCFRALCRRCCSSSRCCCGRGAGCCCWGRGGGGGGRRRRRDAGGAMAMQPQGQSAQNVARGVSGNASGAATTGEQNPLMGDEDAQDKFKVTACRSASRRSVDVFWTNQLPLRGSSGQGTSGQGTSGQGSSGQGSSGQGSSGQGSSGQGSSGQGSSGQGSSGQGSSGQGSSGQGASGQGSSGKGSSGQRSAQRSSNQQAEKVYMVEVKLASSGGQSPPHPVSTYPVARKESDENWKEEAKRQAITLWDLDPSAEYAISVEGIPVTIDSTECVLCPEDIQEIVEFEGEQVEWVVRQKDSDMSWLNDLHTQTETLQAEIGKMGTELKENHTALKEDIHKTEEKLTQNTKSLQEMSTHSEQSKNVFVKINENFGALQTFLSQKFDKMGGELKTVRKELQKMRQKTEEAEKKPKEAEEKQEEAEEKQNESEEETQNAEETSEHTERELEQVREQATQWRKVSTPTERHHQTETGQERDELEHAWHAAKEQPRERMQRLLQRQVKLQEEQQQIGQQMVRLQEEQQQIMQQIQQTLMQMGQGAGVADGVSDAGDNDNRL